MNREEFSTLVSATLENVAQFAELKAGQKLPRKFAFQWSGRSHPRVRENIVEYIVERVFIDEEHVYPDVHLGVADLLEDGSLLILGIVFGNERKPYGHRWMGNEGPFHPMVGISFLNKLAGIPDYFWPDETFHFITPDNSKHRTPWHVRPDIPKLPDKLRKDISAITPSRSGDLSYWPCVARMKDGTAIDCVYVVPEAPYIRHWGVYPQQDSGKKYISLADVEALTESPKRLPAKFADKLYKSGESGMGYTIFTVMFADGSRQAYGTGNAVDFIDYPKGKNQDDVVDVLPHEGRDAKPLSGPKYYWCLFAE
jgi:hypothetical protein